MTVYVVTEGNNGVQRVVGFEQNTIDEVRDFVSEAMGNAPFVGRVGIPSPITYRVYEE